MNSREPQITEAHRSDGSVAQPTPAMDELLHELRERIAALAPNVVPIEREMYVCEMLKGHVVICTPRVPCLAGRASLSAKYGRHIVFVQT